ncbi:Acyl carrier protein [Streptosporangium subroseum]|jgi:acyl carrier protein|uniref:Acyl carrier protein n=1 Tax=Streptosporangium subroseum TaxID=106412 RepID=A0A239G3E3_9ACTN|nr:acyl carrier protein [Streptosporangium subroseum]SNS62544.1 Acyl carrier protein [Streptosporangium subroseum]
MSDSADDLRGWLVQRVASYLEKDPAEISTSVSLTKYGLDSVYAFVMCGDIEDHLNVTLEPTVAWDYRTIDALAEHLDTLGGR